MFNSILTTFQQFAVACKPGAGGNFLGFPTWYKYLPSEIISGKCTPKIDLLHDPGQIAGILFAFIEILLRVAALVAIGFVISGGVQYMMSQGDNTPSSGQSGKTARARGTIINAIVGLAIAVSASVLVTFLAGRFTR